MFDSHVQQERAENPSPYARTLLVGIGGGGCNAVTHIATSWSGGPDILSVNTDQQALASCPGTQPLAIGSKVTDGLGAGGDPAIGRLAADDDKELLRDAMFGMRFVIMVTALGGGTGTGAAPVIAQIAREEGALTLCFATLPFGFEGDKRMRQAEEGLKVLTGHCDVVVRLPNEYLVAQSADDASLTQTFEQTDEMLGVAIKALAGMLAQTGVINLDFADMRQLVESSSGLCAFGYGEGTGSRRAERAARAALKHPMIARSEGLQHTDTLMVNIVGGTELALKDVQTVMDRITDAARSDAHILMGTAVQEDWSGKLAVSLLVPQVVGGRRRQAPLPSDVPSTSAAGVDDQPERGRTSAKVGAGAGKAARQTKLNFDSNDKGRFKNVEPTMVDGEDLDVPTFIRRGVKLSGDR